MTCARIVAMLALAAVAGGCEPKADPPVEPATAGTHLRAALEAWKAGQPHATLQAASPPIVFNEPLWRDGATLLDYEIGQIELHGRQGRCTVRLNLKDPGGKSQERRIGYLIDTTPQVVIVREGLGG